MQIIAPVLFTAASLLGYPDPAPARETPQEVAMEQVAAATYEHLATAIIELNSTEDELVKSVLLGYNAAAHHHLRAAGHDEKNRQTHLEAAATQISNIANEGDKRIQAVRNRLSKAGHTHHTDAQTKEDYLFIDSKEKKQLLALAQAVSQKGAKATADDLKATGDQLSAILAKAIAPE